MIWYLLFYWKWTFPPQFWFVRKESWKLRRSCKDHIWFKESQGQRLKTGGRSACGHLIHLILFPMRSVLRRRRCRGVLHPIRLSSHLRFCIKISVALCFFLCSQAAWYIVILFFRRLERIWDELYSAVTMTVLKMCTCWAQMVCCSGPRPHTHRSEAVHWSQAHAARSFSFSYR